MNTVDREPPFGPRARRWFALRVRGIIARAVHPEQWGEVVAWFVEHADPFVRFEPFSTYTGRGAVGAWAIDEHAVRTSVPLALHDVSTSATGAPSGSSRLSPEIARTLAARAEKRREAWPRECVECGATWRPIVKVNRYGSSAGRDRCAKRCHSCRGIEAPRPSSGS